jgi:hypothetical protein
MDLNRRDFGKIVSMIGLAAVSSPTLDAMLPHAVASETVINTEITNISLSKVIDHSFMMGKDELIKRWSSLIEDNSKFELEIQTENSIHLFQGGSLSWSNEHDSSINKTQVKVYNTTEEIPMNKCRIGKRYDLDLIMPVNQQGKRGLNYICGNNSYRVVLKDSLLMTWELINDMGV